MNPLFNRDIVSISDLSQSELETIISLAQQIKQSPHQKYLSDKVIASCFFEASTRTRLSFETAIQRQGAGVIGFADSGSTSLAKKGETLSDSIRMLNGYADAIVMRHPMEGAARLAAELADIPVINGGDGSNQHPTQTLLDLFTIFECQGTLERLRVAFVGDLKYGRTVHSLTQALTHFDCTFDFVAPAVLAMPDYILQELDHQNIEYRHSDSLEDIIPTADIIYMTRVQKERFDPTEYIHIASHYILTASMLEHAKPTMKILHPLPRVDEITLDVDKTPHAYYFEQAKNGVYARQALLALVLNEYIPGVLS
ncbi:aspartate carbamoyltransferase [Gynuella sunshinyii]|uniref:Aspartate carbamoyltransferase n=1 Tax=Gynuella sunshinyii YC6258 TaxID=1445510 RepID=A0A0C5VY41_9GAMM|nr:aspartate carbamoyltransferase [Gynuella sunshinyii]AJQ95279.1 aspartate carbamoyltransferase, catalytic chain [Gynuella sunshinyii YC6258]